MSRPHQLAARILPRAHQITRRLFVRLRHAHRDQLAEPSQTSEPLRVTAISLDPIGRRARDL
jgi:hypothetical protein